MDFWGVKTNVGKEAAMMQVEIINTFSSEKRMKIALDFANMGIEQTRKWIKSQHPYWSELEVNLEFVRLMYYDKGTMQEIHWQHYQKVMKEKIRKDWILRFRKMMKEKKWTYDDIAQICGFKSGEVVKATIGRGLPSFAKLVVWTHEQSKV